MVRRLLISVLLLCCPVGAEAGQRARELLEQARQRMTEADFSGALTLLARARRAAAPAGEGGARLAAQIEVQLGVVHAVLGRTAEARQAFTAALRHDAGVELDATKVKRSIYELFRATRDSLWGEISVTTDVPGARVWVDGRDLGQLPARVRLGVGAHELRSAVLGQQVEARTVVVPAGQVLPVHLELRRRCGVLVVRGEPGAEVLFDGVRIGNTPLTLVVPAGEHEVVVADEHRRRRHQITVEPEGTVRLAAGAERPVPRVKRTRVGGRLWTWLALGGAGVSFAVALGFGAAAREDYREYRDLPADQGARGRELERQVRASATKANVLFGVAGGLLATSAVLFFVEGRAPAKRPRISVGPAFGGLCGIQAHAAF